VGAHQTLRPASRRGTFGGPPPRLSPGAVPLVFSSGFCPPPAATLPRRSFGLLCHNCGLKGSDFVFFRLSQPRPRRCRPQHRRTATRRSCPTGPHRLFSRTHSNNVAWAFPGVLVLALERPATRITELTNDTLPAASESSRWRVKRPAARTYLCPALFDPVGRPSRFGRPRCSCALPSDHPVLTRPRPRLACPAADRALKSVVPCPYAHASYPGLLLPRLLFSQPFISLRPGRASKHQT